MFHMSKRKENGKRRDAVVQVCKRTSETLFFPPFFIFFFHFSEMKVGRDDGM